jgi:hypothetical protein
VAFAVSTRCHTCGCLDAKARLELLWRYRTPHWEQSMGTSSRIAAFRFGTLACARSVSCH